MARKSRADEIKELQEKDGKHSLNYTFHILRVLPKSMSIDEVLKLEIKYKEMYLTKVYGLNKN